MSDVSRRNAVRLIGGALLGAGVMASNDAFGLGEKKAVPSTAKAADDPLLHIALMDPQGFMFGEPVTFKLPVKRYSMDLFIASARDTRLLTGSVRVPSGTVRIFRADATADDFTKQGGLYWEYDGKKGKTQLKQPGALVMLIRDNEETVHCYSLMPDLRC